MAIVGHTQIKITDVYIHKEEVDVQGVTLNESLLRIAIGAKNFLNNERWLGVLRTSNHLLMISSFFLLSKKSAKFSILIC